ncbi:DUF2905 domain-containing protein [Hymenobacter actinosclerus]|uniref:DUF2905 domain-containing protein n=1 Tax=Hymenobacter actinosclerus TaxID=82805 RepID=A0A1I0BV26_9BACT|nr:DUF2905 domain-containing protein [Hymenobacter actinosclerus]SET10621.1 Protein of unknown function [Hymenobacter actinosclerus]
MPPHLGKTLFLLGLGLMLLGGLLWLGGGAAGWFSWFGRLPGDVRVERPGFRLYVPWVSMLVISAVVSLLLALWRRLGG